jgi:hypothetical protein
VTERPSRAYLYCGSFIWTSVDTKHMDAWGQAFLQDKRLLAALVVLALVLVAVAAGAAADHRRSLVGYWAGTPSFLADAGLSEMQLFVAPPRGGSHDGYLVMADSAGALLANTAVTVAAPWLDVAAGAAAFTRAFSASGFAVSGTAFTVRAADGAALPFDGPLTADLSLADGLLVLRRGTTVVACLARDADASAAALMAWAEK